MVEVTSWLGLEPTEGSLGLNVQEGSSPTWQVLTWVDGNFWGLDGHCSLSLSTPPLHIASLGFLPAQQSQASWTFYVATSFPASECSRRPGWKGQDFFWPNLRSYTVSLCCIPLPKKWVTSPAQQGPEDQEEWFVVGSFLWTDQHSTWVGSSSLRTFDF